MATLAQIDKRNKAAAELAEHVRQINMKAAQVKSDVVSRKQALAALKVTITADTKVFTAEDIAEVDAASAMLVKQVVDLAAELQ